MISLQSKKKEIAPFMISVSAVYDECIKWFPARYFPNIFVFVWHWHVSTRFLCYKDKQQVIASFTKNHLVGAGRLGPVGNGKIRTKILQSQLWISTLWWISMTLPTTWEIERILFSSKVGIESTWKICVRVKFKTKGPYILGNQQQPTTYLKYSRSKFIFDSSYQTIPILY